MRILISFVFHECKSSCSKLNLAFVALGSTSTWCPGGSSTRLAFTARPTSWLALWRIFADGNDGEPTHGFLMVRPIRSNLFGIDLSVRLCRIHVLFVHGAQASLIVQSSLLDLRLVMGFRARWRAANWKGVKKTELICCKKKCVANLLQIEFWAIFFAEFCTLKNDFTEPRTHRGSRQNFGHSPRTVHKTRPGEVDLMLKIQSAIQMVHLKNH